MEYAAKVIRGSLPSFGLEVRSFSVKWMFKFKCEGWIKREQKRGFRRDVIQQYAQFFYFLHF